MNDSTSKRQETTPGHDDRSAAIKLRRRGTVPARVLRDPTISDLAVRVLALIECNSGPINTAQIAQLLGRDEAPIIEAIAELGAELALL